MRATDRRPAALLVCGGFAALLYSNFLLDWTRRGFVGMDDIVSQLEATGQPHALLLRGTDLICVVLVAGLLPSVRRSLPRGSGRQVVVWSTAAFALGAAVAALVPTPCGPEGFCTGHQLQSSVHDIASIASDAMLFVGVAAAWVTARRPGPAWLTRAACWLFWVGGVVSSALFTYFEATDDPDWAVGASQRVHIVCISVWIACLAVLAARHAHLLPTPSPSTRAQELHDVHDH